MKIISIIFFSLFLYGKLNLMTEDYPPYNFIDKNGNIKGISVDIVREIIKRTGDIDNITIMPWARSYHKIQTQRNQVLFVMTRTPQRENLFKWVGPIATNIWVFYAKRDSKIDIKSIYEVKNTNIIIGTYKDDACELYLKELGFKNIESVSNDLFNVKKLMSGRIDLWITGKYQGLIKAKRLGYSKKDLKEVLDIKKTYLYIAFSKDVSNKIIQKWQEELDKLKKSGIYQKILDKYLK